jgi:WS/DGAT/MGAT family acyltransferase
VRAIAKAFECSINDVLLACVAGAIGSYLRDSGEDTGAKEIRTMVPINLRSGEQVHELGNRFGLVPLLLPIGIANPVERVYAIRGRMDEIKGGYQPLLAFGALALAGLMIRPAHQAMMKLFARKATAVITNVPGPEKPLRLCGAAIEQVMFWAPRAGDIGMGVSMLSYANAVQFGLITDRKLCPDPEKIIERFAPEFETLLLAAMMLPWSDDKKPGKRTPKNRPADDDPRR